jgi:T-complex protein 1 subunit theta
MFRNIDAVQQLSKLTKTALGPHGKYIINLNFRLFFPLFLFKSLILIFSLGMNKMVINHLEKIFVTSDAACILRESDIHHPAAKMVA